LGRGSVSSLASKLGLWGLRLAFSFQFSGIPLITTHCPLITFFPLSDIHMEVYSFFLQSIRPSNLHVLGSSPIVWQRFR
jgi:hypothetical protein